MTANQRKTGTFESIVIGLSNMLEPLESALGNDGAKEFLESIGIDIPEGVDALPGFINGVQKVLTAVGKTPGIVEAIITAVNADNYSQVISLAEQLIQQVKNTIEGIKEIEAAVDSLSKKPDTEAKTAALSGVVDQLMDFLLVTYLDKYYGVPEALEFIGVISRPAVGQEGSYNFSVDNLIDFIKDPAGRLQEIYQWGQPDFDDDKLLTVLKNILVRLGVPAVIVPNGAPNNRDLIDAFLVQIHANDGDPGLKISVEHKIETANTLPLSQGEEWKLEALLNGDLEAGASIIIHPDGNLTFNANKIAASGEFGVRFTAGKENDEPFIIFGEAEGSRLQVAKFIAQAIAGLNFDANNMEASAKLNVSGEIVGGKLVVDASGGDGFISTLMSAIKLESDFSMGFGFDSEDGLYFTGSSTLEIQLPTHVDLGPVSIDAITLSVGIEDSSFPISISANVGASLGPLQTAIEGIGVTGTLSVAENPEDGNLGPLNFDIAFKPPKGVGLAVDAGIVKGGGYLFLDPERGEYAGALELVFSEWIALRAVGVINTIMPDGSKGFSMIIVITAEFGSGIQLGFGFTLLGVGGIVGINRIVNIDPLKEGVKNGSVESVMFPQNVVANAPKIISDLKSFFPVKEDSFLIGPMAKIGWGTPTLMSVSLGLIIEIPEGNITILGVVKVVLPDENADVLRLQVNFIGRIEPSNKLLWFAAYLYDSRVLFITLEGGMGLLVQWGDQANFVVSVGGFHPKYSPPPLPFDAPSRIAVNILNESYAKVRIEGYFAVTSNSVQFGAKVEVFFGVSAFNIDGHLAFDALFQFDPFFFSFSLSMKLGVKVFGIGLFSVGFSGTLEGPTPWHIAGKGEISLLFFDIKVPFSHTWGDKQDTSLEKMEVMPLLVEELSALTNWQAILPASNNVAVTLREMTEEDSKLVLHPVGSFKISQRKLPLNYEFEKFGNKKTSDVKALDFDVEFAGGGELASDYVDEQFAIGQLRDLDDGDRLSKPGFEYMDAGREVKIKDAQIKANQAVVRKVRYEEIIIDNNFRRYTRRFFFFFRSTFVLINKFLFNFFLQNSAVAQAEVSQTYKKKLQPRDEKVAVNVNEYSVAFNEDNTSIDLNKTFKSVAMADQYLAQQLQANPALTGQLHVIPNTELNDAA